MSLIQKIIDQQQTFRSSFGILKQEFEIFKVLLPVILKNDVNPYLDRSLIMTMHEFLLPFLKLYLERLLSNIQFKNELPLLGIIFKQFNHHEKIQIQDAIKIIDEKIKDYQKRVINPEMELELQDKPAQIQLSIQDIKKWLLKSKLGKSLIVCQEHLSKVLNTNTLTLLASLGLFWNFSILFKQYTLGQPIAQSLQMINAKWKRLKKSKFADGFLVYLTLALSLVNQPWMLWIGYGVGAALACLFIIQTVKLLVTFFFVFKEYLRGDVLKFEIENVFGFYKNFITTTEKCLPLLFEGNQLPKERLEELFVEHVNILKKVIDIQEKSLSTFKVLYKFQSPQSKQLLLNVTKNIKSLKVEYERKKDEYLKKVILLSGEKHLSLDEYSVEFNEDEVLEKPFMGDHSFLLNRISSLLKMVDESYMPFLYQTYCPLNLILKNIQLGLYYENGLINKSKIKLDFENLRLQLGPHLKDSIDYPPLLAIEKFLLQEKEGQKAKDKQEEKLNPKNLALYSKSMFNVGKYLSDSLYQGYLTVPSEESILQVLSRYLYLTKDVTKIDKEWVECLTPLDKRTCCDEFLKKKQILLNQLSHVEKIMVDFKINRDVLELTDLKISNESIFISLPIVEKLAMALNESIDEITILHQSILNQMSRYLEESFKGEHDIYVTFAPWLNQSPFQNRLTDAVILRILYLFKEENTNLLTHDEKEYLFVRQLSSPFILEAAMMQHPLWGQKWSISIERFFESLVKMDILSVMFLQNYRCKKLDLWLQLEDAKAVDICDDEINENPNNEKHDQAAKEQKLSVVNNLKLNIQVSRHQSKFFNQHFGVHNFLKYNEHFRTFLNVSEIKPISALFFPLMNEKNLPVPFGFEAPEIQGFWSLILLFDALYPNLQRRRLVLTQIFNKIRESDTFETQELNNQLEACLAYYLLQLDIKKFQVLLTLHLDLMIFSAKIPSLFHQLSCEFLVKLAHSPSHQILSLLFILLKSNFQNLPLLLSFIDEYNALDMVHAKFKLRQSVQPSWVLPIAVLSEFLKENDVLFNDVFTMVTKNKDKNKYLVNLYVNYEPARDKIINFWKLHVGKYVGHDAKNAFIWIKILSQYKRLSQTHKSRIEMLLEQLLPEIKRLQSIEYIEDITICQKNLWIPVDRVAMGEYPIMPKFDVNRLN